MRNVLRHVTHYTMFDWKYKPLRMEYVTRNQQFYQYGNFFSEQGFGRFIHQGKDR
jgi:hypothetical protein